MSKNSQHLVESQNICTIKLPLKTLIKQKNENHTRICLSLFLNSMINRQSHMTLLTLGVMERGIREIDKHDLQSYQQNFLI